MKRLLVFGIYGILLLIPKSLKDIAIEAREPASLSRRPSSTAESVHIVPMNPDFSTDELKQDGYTLTTDDVGDDEPAPEARDEIFRKVGVWSYAKKLDQLDRSFLYLRAREYTGKQFAKKYPMLDQATRAKLQEAAKRGGWSP